MAAPEEVNEATHEFLRDHPDAEAALRNLLERDETVPWTFNDVELDSGQFGELVSRDIAKQTAEGGYRLQHPEAIQVALAGETWESTDEGELNIRLWIFTTVSPSELGGLLIALAVVTGARLHAYGAVFRDGYVVSPGNDPYFYRYWQIQLLEYSSGPLDVGMLRTVGEVTPAKRPLTHAINWWLAELLGGNAEAAATVAAWLPVVGVIMLGCVLYLLARLLTGDIRVGLAAVTFLGLAPIHVVYTNVGFLEHRLHQYLWLGILVCSLTWLAVDVQRRSEGSSGSTAAHDHFQAPKSWAVAGVVATAVGASAHIWTGSPLTFIPVALYINFRIVADVRAGISPIFANAPMIAGLATGSFLSLALHLGLGWHGTIAAVTPLLVTLGAVSVVGLGEGWQRLGFSLRGLLVAETLTGIVGIIGIVVLQPIDLAQLQDRMETLLFREGVTEATTLFSADQAFLLGPLWQIGISFYFGIVALAAATFLVTRRYEPGWLLSICCAWYYMVLAAFQSRFGAQLVIFIALFAGISFVYLLASVELARPFEPFSKSITDTVQGVTVPNSRQSAYLLATICLVLVGNFIFVPTLVGQTTHGDEQFEAALAIDNHAAATDRTYPDTAIETRWDNIRMYNYFVNGESKSYDSRYEQFLTADHPDNQYSELRKGGKYVVMNRWSESRGVTYEVLYNGLGVGYSDVETTAGRYQPVYIGEGVRAFTVVEGAVLNVTGENGRKVTASTTVRIDGAVTYERSGVIEEGNVELRVAHPGNYTVDNETVTITTDDVYSGEQFEIGDH